MTSDRHQPPPEIHALAEQRAAARAARNYATADQLKLQIEAAGWKVIDAGPRFRLEPAYPPNVEEDGIVRYGSSVGVPARFHESNSAELTIVLVGEPPADTPPPPDTQLIVVTPVNASPALASAEVLTTAGDLGLAAAWNIGLRRAIGSVVALLGPGVVPGREDANRLVAGLGDASVGVVGWPGLASNDLRRWASAPAGDVDALDAGVLALRRRDAIQRGPLDERFATPQFLAVWWSLVLRDEGADRPPRRAVALEPSAESGGRRPEAPWPSAVATTDADADRDRQARRDLYRLIDRFGRRLDLLREPVKPTAASVRARRQSQ